ncbi:hypothetical protein ACHAWC_005119 [Mediolabrus comicus]
MVKHSVSLIYIA